MAKEYKLGHCEYCRPELGHNPKNWCEQRANGKWQCRACKVERYFERFLYPPLGMKLQNWGRKTLRELYGTVHESTGLRQYRKGYISTGKQNGKSFILGGLPIYHLLMEEVLNPEAYGVASARDQASIVFKACNLLIEANPVLQSKLRVIQSTKHIVRRDGGGLYCVLSADGNVQDGKRPSLLLVDELHRFSRKKAETVLTVLKKGMISRAPVIDGVQTGEPLMIQTTTSGDETESPLWFSEYEHATKVLSGAVEDPQYYAAIYQADPKRIENELGYWKTREARVAGNPSHEDNGGFLADSEIEKDMLDAVEHPEKYGDYVRLNLNVPVIATGTPIIDMALWTAGGGEIDLRTWPEYDVELLIRKLGLISRPCVAGIDMAWTTDFASVSLLFPPAEAGEPWKILIFFWIPEGRVGDLKRKLKVPMEGWIRQGFLTTTPGSEIDMNPIIDKIRWAAEMFDVREVTFDRWGSVKSAVDLTLVRDGMTCYEIPQTFAGISTATKKLVGLYMNQQFEHCNNPILRWNAGCLALKTDGGDNAKPEKPKRDTATKRIDGIAATVTALARAMFLESGESVYETGGIKTL